MNDCRCVIGIFFSLRLISEKTNDAHDRVGQVRETINYSCERAGFENINTMWRNRRAGSRGNIVGLALQSHKITAGKQDLRSSFRKTKRSCAAYIGSAAKNEEGFAICHLMRSSHIPSRWDNREVTRSCA